jgi:hypothetical protein
MLQDRRDPGLEPRGHVREFNPKQKEPHWGVDVAETRFEENDPEGVAFEYEVLE